jgi:hypothetical protein
MVVTPKADAVILRANRWRKKHLLDFARAIPFSKRLPDVSASEIDSVDCLASFSGM